jgi:Protein of unknown function (DUF3631)
VFTGGVITAAGPGPEKGSGERRNDNELVTYDYVDPDGALLFQKVRNPPGRKPPFWCRRPNGHGGWINNIKGIEDRPLYRRPQIAAAIAEDREIAVAKGEKDCDRLWSIGIPATCNFDGTSDVIKNPKAKPKWKAEYSEALRGARLVVFNDNDPPGYAHADNICKLSLGVAKCVRRLDLKVHWPEIPKGGDVSDWLAVGGEHTPERLRELIEAVPDYAAGGGDGKGGDEPGASEAAAPDDDAEIERLARMSHLEYERTRKSVAEALGVRAAMLDLIVKGKRLALGLADDGKEGRAIIFVDPALWPEPVNGARLLDAISLALTRHVVLPQHGATICTLWIAHTYLLDHLDLTPRLQINSPAKQCGKSTLLDVLDCLVYRPQQAAHATVAALFRLIDKWRPTLLIDEGDTFITGEDEELRGVLNSGHLRRGTVSRVVGDQHEVKVFSTFGAVAIALIGELPDTLADRSVTVPLVRRKRDEPIANFAGRRPKEALVPLTQQMMRWTRDNGEAIGAAQPEMPRALYNRLADNWHALLAIADAAGGDWPNRARTAATHDLDPDAASVVEMLVADIATVFAKGALDFINSADLAAALVRIEGRPWAEYSRGKPLSTNMLARLLKPLKIAPRPDTIGDVRGYRRGQFNEAFERYLGSEGVSNRQTVRNADGMGTSEASPTVRPGMASDGCEPVGNADGMGTSDGLTVGKGGNGHTEPSGPSTPEPEAQGGPLLCAYCGRPGGNRLAWDGIELVLHPDCEAPFIDRRMREEGIAP